MWPFRRARSAPSPPPSSLTHRDTTSGLFPHFLKAALLRGEESVFREYLERCDLRYVRLGMQDLA